MTVKIVIVDRLQSDKDCLNTQPAWSSDADSDTGSFDDRDLRITAQLADGQVKLTCNLNGAQLSPDRAIKLAELLASAAKEVKDFDELTSNSTYEERVLKLEPASGASWHEKYEDRTFYRNKDILD